MPEGHVPKAKRLNGAQRKPRVMRCQMHDNVKTLDKMN